MQNTFKLSLRMLMILSLLLLGACAGGSQHMRDVISEKANYDVKPNKALVVFMRPSGVGFAIQSPVFDIDGGKANFIGIVSAMTKIAHYAEPGKKRFMVIGESADFMDATLDAGKAYYALMTPRFGVWKARFSLKPVRNAEMSLTEFDSDYKGSRWVENKPSSHEWARSNAKSIRSKMTEYLPDWENKPDRPTLAANDGRAKPFGAN